MSQNPVTFGSKMAKEILKVDQELDQMSAVCPECFTWAQEDRPYCTVCEGEGCIPAWDVIAYFRPLWKAAWCKRYLKTMSERDDRTRDTLYAILTTRI